MYKSPIQANYAEPIYEQIRDAFDNEVFKAVQAVNIEVDKDELIKALRYDRGQYDKGYWDGRAYKPPVTNADRIRAMTDEELAKEMSVRLSEDCLMCPVLEADCPAWDNTKNAECKDAMLGWLKQEVDDG